jgi:hypothetical protein
MAYIRKRDDHANANGPESKKQNKDTDQMPLIGYQDDDYDDDLDGEEDMDEEVEDRIFKKSFYTEFPLPGGETDEDAGINEQVH